MAEFEKWKNPPKANFVISKKLAGEEGAEVCVRYSIRCDVPRCCNIRHYCSAAVINVLYGIFCTCAT